MLTWKDSFDQLLGRIGSDVLKFHPLEGSLQISLMLDAYLGFHHHVIAIHFHGVPLYVDEQPVNHPLIGVVSNDNLEGHYGVGINVIVRVEGRMLCILLNYHYLVIT